MWNPILTAVTVAGEVVQVVGFVSRPDGVDAVCIADDGEVYTIPVSAIRAESRLPDKEQL